MTLAVDRGPRRADGEARLAMGGHVPTPRRHAWERACGWSLRLLDAGLVLISIGSALLVRFGDRAPDLTGAPLPLLRSYVGISVALAVGWLGALAAGRTYDRRVLGVGVEEFRRVLATSLWFWGLVAIGCYVWRVDLARGYVAVAFLLGTTLLLAGRYWTRRWLRRMRLYTTDWSSKVLVVGDREPVRDLVTELRRRQHVGFHVVGVCLPGTQVLAVTDEGDVPVLGDLRSVPEVALEAGVDAVAVASSDAVLPADLRRLGWALEGTDVDLIVAPSLMDLAGPRVLVRPVAELPLLYVEQPELTVVRRVVKGLFDRLAAGLLLALLAPLMLLIVAVVRLDGKGPALFRQECMGAHGRKFVLYKFRSMRTNAEERRADLVPTNCADRPLFKLWSDPPVTRVGRLLRRYSLDGLPQLLNVLLGEMSLVGPRPPLPAEVEKYASHVQRRPLVKPGITGLWHVSERSTLPWDEAVRSELYYVENWSLASDLLILAKTLRVVWRGERAY